MYKIKKLENTFDGFTNKDRRGALVRKRVAQVVKALKLFHALTNNLNPNSPDDRPNPNSPHTTTFFPSQDRSRHRHRHLRLNSPPPFPRVSLISIQSTSHCTSSFLMEVLFPFPSIFSLLDFFFLFFSLLRLTSLSFNSVSDEDCSFLEYFCFLPTFLHFFGFRFSWLLFGG